MNYNIIFENSQDTVSALMEEVEHCKYIADACSANNDAAQAAQWLVKASKIQDEIEIILEGDPFERQSTRKANFLRRLLLLLQRRPGYLVQSVWLTSRHTSSNAER